MLQGYFRVQKDQQVSAAATPSPAVDYLDAARKIILSEAVAAYIACKGLVGGATSKVELEVFIALIFLAAALLLRILGSRPLSATHRPGLPLPHGHGPLPSATSASISSAFKVGCCINPRPTCSMVLRCLRTNLAACRQRHGCPPSAS